MIAFILAFVGIFSPKSLSKKDKQIVDYIHNQRKNGHRDGSIRTQMEK